MKITKILLSLALASLTACGGGGSGSYSTGGVYFTHEQLANEFVRRVNTDVAGYNLTLMKANTEQYGYIVVQGVYANDPYNSYYDAYYIQDWGVGQDLNQYLWDYQNYFYYSLNYIGNGYYEATDGTLFDEVGDSKNFETLQASAQKIVNNHVSAVLMTEYGMNEETATLAAKLSNAMRNNPDITSADVDSASKKLIGYSVTDLNQTFQSGDESAIREKVEAIEAKTGMDEAKLQKLALDFASGIQK